MEGELARRSSFKIPDARVRIIMDFRRVVPYAEAIGAQRYEIDFPKVVYSRKVHFTDCSNYEESVDASVTHFTAQAGVAPLFPILHTIEFNHRHLPLRVVVFR